MPVYQEGYKLQHGWLSVYNLDVPPPTYKDSFCCRISVGIEITAEPDSPVMIWFDLGTSTHESWRQLMMRTTDRINVVIDEDGAISFSSKNPTQLAGVQQLYGFDQVASVIRLAFARGYELEDE